MNKYSKHFIETYDILQIVYKISNWQNLSQITTAKYYHSLVVAKNKMFVIGNGKSRFEFFDDSWKKFVILKSPEVPTQMYTSVKTTSFGNKIVVVEKNSSVAYCYDINKGEWSNMSFGYAGYCLLTAYNYHFENNFKL